ncbi:MAG: hypothetical protein GY953_48100, partial [bacterium]|nr:hypothetical protein [bacterium]
MPDSVVWESRLLFLMLFACCVTGPACHQDIQETQPGIFLVDRVPTAPGTFTRSDLVELRDKGLLSTSVTLGEVTRRSLTPSLPAKLTFAVELPSDPVLRFALAVATLGKPKDRNLV